MGGGELGLGGLLFVESKLEKEFGEDMRESKVEDGWVYWILVDEVGVVGDIKISKVVG